MRLGPWVAKGFIWAVALAMLFLTLVQQRIITLPRQYDPYATPDLREPPSWYTQTRMQTLDNNADACEEALTEAGLKVSLMPSSYPEPDCALENTIQVSRLSQAAMKPEQTRCAIAARLYMWERHVLQPLAQQQFGEPVKEITHFGSYSCRNIRNSAHMSQHATANAMDVSGFVFRSGHKITVKNKWNAGDRDDAFLHEARAGLCQYFNLTLSPDYNTDHEDHFHVDMGSVRNCR